MSCRDAMNRVLPHYASLQCRARFVTDAIQRVPTSAWKDVQTDQDRYCPVILSAAKNLRSHASGSHRADPKLALRMTRERVLGGGRPVSCLVHRYVAG